MRTAGLAEGWGVGRQVLGFNYFYRVRDPWGRLTASSLDIDFVSPATGWGAGDHAPKDSFYLWGPAGPQWFVRNADPAD